VSYKDGPAYYYRFSRLYEMHFSLPPFSTWVEKNHESLLACLPEKLSGDVLDIGGGIGRLSRALARRYPGQQVLSIDTSAAMTERARTDAPLENLRFETQSFWDVDGQFDLVVCAGCWEFFQLQPSAMRLVQLLKPGGTAVVNTLGPAVFGRVRESVFRQVFRTDVWLHRPQSLTEELEVRGCRVRWNPVNLLEGSYTLVARRSD